MQIIKRTYNWIKKKWKQLLCILGIGTAVVLAVNFNVGSPVIQSVNADELYLDIQDINTYVENGKIRKTNSDIYTLSTITGGESTTTDYSYEMKRARFHAFFSGYEITDGITTTDPVELRYEVDGKSITFKPVGLRWSNGDIISNTQETVIPQVSGNEILYEDLFGEGLSVKGITQNTRFQKLFIIENAEALGTPPDGVEYVEVVFEIEKDIVVDGWDTESDYEITEQKRLGDYSYLKNAKVWNDATSTDIRSFFKKKDDTLYFVKRIPAKWLKTQDFPVYTDSDIQYGQISEIRSATTRYIRGTALDTNKVIECDLDNVSVGTCIAGYVTGKSFNWGASSAQFVADGYVSAAHVDFDVCKLDTTRFLVVFQDDTDDDGYAIVGYATSTTISFGTAVEFSSNADTNLPTCAVIDTDKAVVCYEDETNSDGSCVVLTIEDEQITVGTITDFDTSITTDQNDTAKLDTDKFIHCFEESNNSKCVAATVSGTTITFGSQNTCDIVNGYSTSRYNVISPDTDKFVLGWQENCGSRICIGTVSTRTITFGDSIGAKTTFGEACEMDIIPLDTTHILHIYTDTLDRGKSEYMTVDFGTRTVSTTTNEFFSGGDLVGSYKRSFAGLKLASDKVAIFFERDDLSDHAFGVVGTYLGTPTETDWDYYKQITIEAGDTSDGHIGGVATTTATAFVVTVTTTDSDLKTTTHGGHVKADYGDFLFTDTGFTTFYDFETETYASTTGQVVFHIRIPDGVSSTSDTNLRMYYGNANGHDYSNVKATWGDATGTDPVSVWHLSETPTVDSYAYDSTQTNNDATISSFEVADQISGQIDGSLNADGDGEYGVITATIITGDWSVMGWVDSNEVTPTAYTNFFGCSSTELFNAFEAKPRAYVSATDCVIAVNTIDNTKFYHLAFTHKNGLYSVYIDGELDNTNSTTALRLYYCGVGSTNWDTDNTIDEVRVYNQSLTRADIKTLYNMQSDQSAFITWGAETATVAAITQPDDVEVWIRDGEIRCIQGQCRFIGQ